MITPKQIRQIRKLVKKGLGNRDIAKMMNIKPISVYNTIKQCKLREIRHPFKLSKAEVEKIKELFAKGYTYPKVAEIYGCTWYQISYQCRKYGIAPRHNRPYIYNDDLNAKIIELWNGGMPIDDICVKLNLKPNTVKMKLHNLRKKGYPVKYKKDI